MLVTVVALVWLLPDNKTLGRGRVWGGRGGVAVARVWPLLQAKASKSVAALNPPLSATKCPLLLT